MEVEGIAELPADSNPLTETLLRETLEKGLSSNNHQLIGAKQQLEEWQSREDYYPKLQAIFADRNVPYDIRFNAVIQLKNGIEKHWRRGSAAMILEKHKDELRPRILTSGLQESDRRLADLVALVVAKIARFDFPTKWPDVVSDLVKAIRQFSGPEFQNVYPFQLRRALLLLFNIVKEVAQNRIGPGRAKLRSFAEELLRVLGAVYFSSFERSIFQEVVSDPSTMPMLEASLEQSLLTIKTIRRLILLLDRIRSNDTVKQFWDHSLPEFQSILQIVLSSHLFKDENDPVTILVHKNLRQITKLHVHIAKNNPTDFTLLQDPTFEVVRMHWQLVSLLGQQYACGSNYPAIVEVMPNVQNFDESKKSLVDKLGHQALLLLRACIKMIAMPGRGMRYRTPEEKSQDADAVIRLRKTIFTDSAVLELVNHMVLEILLFQPKDLVEWEEEPDEWEKREELGSEDFEFATRPCAEKLLLDLTMHFKETTIPELLKMVSTVTVPDFSSMLQKESVYCAIGLAAPYLDKKLDFKNLLLSHLVPEIQIQNPQYKILRRRIAILVGQWSTIEESNGCRPIYFQVFQFLLNKDDPLNDQVVRVSAGRQLSRAVDAFETTAEDFIPYADSTLTQVMGLIEEVEYPETKMALLNTISVIVQRLEIHITPFADRIVNILPQLWDQSGEEHLMKQTVVALLTRLFVSMKETGAKYHHFVLPIIRETVIPGSPLGTSLLEEALDAWSTIIQQTPTAVPGSIISPDLLSLIEFLIPLLDQDTENLEKAIEIFEGYIVLVPDVMLSREVLPKALQAFKAKLGAINYGHSGHVTKAVELAWKTAFALQGVGGAQELTFQMLQSGFFDGLINGLKEAWEAHQTTGPKAIHTKIQGIIETDFLAIMSRIACDSPEVFLEALKKSEAASIPPSAPRTSNNIAPMDPPVQWLFDEWFSHIEDFGDPERHKLMTMALTKILNLPQFLLYSHMQSLLSLWTSVTIELTDETVDTKVDSLVWPPKPPEQDTEPSSADETRRTAIERIDPVHTVNLNELIRSGLGEFIQRCGGEQKFQEEILANVDQEVIKQFGALNIM